MGKTDAFFVQSGKSYHCHTRPEMAKVGVLDHAIDFSDPTLGKHAGTLLIGEQDDGFGTDHGRLFVKPHGNVDYFHSDSYREVKRWLNLFAKKQDGAISFFERKWYKKRSLDLKFADQLRIFQINTHGTAMASIIAKKNPKVEIYEMVGLEPEQPRNATFFMSNTTETAIENLKRLPKRLFDRKMTDIVERAGKAFKNRYQRFASFAKEQGLDVINGSYISQIMSYMERILQKDGILLDAKQKNDLHHRLVVKINSGIKEAMSCSHNTLFVYAAGNHGDDIDRLPQTPASVESEQSLTVAAVDMEGNLAPFSNYGAESTDIAALGMGVSTIDLGEFYMSGNGTSHAAAIVSRAASLVKDMNPKLMPQDVKSLLIGTVDIAPHLKNKVKSGILNVDRALLAAKETLKGLSIEESCLIAHKASQEMMGQKPDSQRVQNLTLISRIRRILSIFRKKGDE